MAAPATRKKQPQLFREPYIVGLYGDPGAGKGVLFWNAFTQAFGIGPEAGFSSTTNHLGFPAAYYKGKSPVHTLKQIMKCLVYYAKRGRTVFLFDDMSIVLANTLRGIREEFGGWDVWSELKTQTLALQSIITDYRLTVGFTFWASPAETKNGVFLPSRPQIPSREATTIFVGIMSTCIGLFEQRARMTNWKWTITGRATQDRMAKDRNDVCGIDYPPSLRAVLREAGLMAQGPDFKLPGIPGLKGYDYFVENVGYKTLCEIRAGYSADEMVAFGPGQLLRPEDQKEWVLDMYARIKKGGMAKPQWMRLLLRESLAITEIRARREAEMLSEFWLDDPLVTGKTDSDGNPWDDLGKSSDEKAAIADLDKEAKAILEAKSDRKPPEATKTDYTASDDDDDFGDVG